jgi:hypothetical protein
MIRCLTNIHTAVLLAMSLSLPFTIPRAAQAVPVLISTEGLPAIDLAQRDSAGMLRLYSAEDVDGDGMISFAADLEPQRAVYSPSGLCFVLSGPNLLPDSSIPLFITGTDERVITQWNSLPTQPFMLGEPFSVSDGQIPGFDAVIYRSPGNASAAEIVDLDLTTLPLYTGPAQVGGLLRYQIVPEPSGAMLLAVACCTWASVRFIRRVPRAKREKLRMPLAPPVLWGIE